MMLKNISSKMYRLCVFWLCIFIKCALFVIALDSPVMPAMDTLGRIPFKAKEVPPCTACSNLVKSFLAAVERTSRQTFAGGDADWERQKLKGYENSELRFIEIQEVLCTDVGPGIDQCYNLAEEYESELEDWFYENRKKNIDLHTSLCINHLKVCCPNNTYGFNCIPCPGGTENPCGGHGKCLKGGTREEPASCSCDDGYSGDLCEECAKGYYQELNTNSLTCEKCDKACKNHCRGPGPKNCEVCATGYNFFPDEGCIEVEISSDSDDTNKETSDSGHGNSSTDPVDSDGKELKLDSNLEDSTVDVPHSEL